MPPDLPDLPTDNEIIQCVAGVVSQIPDELGLLGGWIIETGRTVAELVEARRRCLDMTNERLRDACLTSWNISVGIEGLRLASDLRQFTDSDTVDWFLVEFFICFNVDPDASAQH